VTLGLGATGAVVLGNWWLNQVMGGSTVEAAGSDAVVAPISEPILEAAAQVVVEAENGKSSKPTWQEITAKDTIPFPESVNRYAEHYWSALSEAIRVTKERGLVPEGFDEAALFAELIVAVRAVTMVESRGNPNAVSKSGARGLMQLMPKYFLNSGESVEILFDPQVNIFRGVHHFTILWLNALKELGAWVSYEAVGALAAARYNGGESRLADGSNWSCETRTHVERFKEARQKGDWSFEGSCD